MFRTLIVATIVFSFSPSASGQGKSLAEKLEDLDGKIPVVGRLQVLNEVRTHLKGAIGDRDLLVDLRKQTLNARSAAKYLDQATKVGLLRRHAGIYSQWMALSHSSSGNPGGLNRQLNAKFAKTPAGMEAKAKEFLRNMPDPRPISCKGCNQFKIKGIPIPKGIKLGDVVAVTVESSFGKTTGPHDLIFESNVKKDRFPFAKIQNGKLNLQLTMTNVMGDAQKFRNLVSIRKLTVSIYTLR